MDLETTEAPLEELSGKDEEMVSLMQSAMQHPAGDIRFKEHVLPLPEDTGMLQSLVSQVCFTPPCAWVLFRLVHCVYVPPGTSCLMCLASVLYD